jgi:hypothetical protein
MEVMRDRLTAAYIQLSESGLANGDPRLRHIAQLLNRIKEIQSLQGHPLG